MDDERDPWSEGYEAQEWGAPESANPYDLHTDEDAHLSWNDGWMSAAEDEEVGRG